ncbi:hypothetical protein EFK68_03650 [Pseudomonas aeruginosa]|nr:hypothetical protein EFK68_03650 [Pseudomonas aeruginosa]
MLIASGICWRLSLDHNSTILGHFTVQLFNNQFIVHHGQIVSLTVMRAGLDCHSSRKGGTEPMMAVENLNSLLLELSE